MKYNMSKFEFKILILLDTLYEIENCIKDWIMYPYQKGLFILPNNYFARILNHIKYQYLLPFPICRQHTISKEFTTLPYTTFTSLIQFFLFQCIVQCTSNFCTWKTKIGLLMDIGSHVYSNSLEEIFLSTPIFLMNYKKFHQSRVNHKYIPFFSETPYAMFHKHRYFM